MNSSKGHQGFTSKYKVLGDTKLVRVPVSVCQEIKHMLVLMEAIAFQQGQDAAVELLDKINEQLAERLP